MYLEQFFIDGLGCASYLVGCEGAGVAAVVDPDRDMQKYLDAAAAHGLSITPVPGGGGPMTVAMLVSNTVQAAQRHLQERA